MKILFVVGHLRNYYENPKRFIDSYLSKFDCDLRILLTHKENGWWTGDRNKTMEDGEPIDLGKVNPDSFFNKIDFLNIDCREETIGRYNILGLHPHRSYYREPSYKIQIVHRYLAMLQLKTMIDVSENDTIILTRPDILLKDESMMPVMNKSIQQFNESEKELLLFDAGGIPHDCIIVGKPNALERLFSSEVYNTNQYAQPHENLDRIGTEMFDSMRILVRESYYYANSPNMRQYGT